MDYSLGALKVVCSQLKEARETPSQNAMNLGGILFQRAWLQGVLVSDSDSDVGDDRFLLDDGTGVIELSLSGEFRLRQWMTGMYVMAVGGYFLRTGEPPVIKVFDFDSIRAKMAGYGTGYSSNLETWFTRLLIYRHFRIEKQCGILKLWRHTNCSTSP